MKELNNIIFASNTADQTGRKFALATIVHLNGSSYRGPGARMLISDAGELTGAISGGCLEGDALRKAMLVLSQQQSKLVTYDTSDEEDATVGIQLGCEGVIQVLFEPIQADNPNNPIQLLSKAVAIRQQAVLVTLFSLENKRHDQAGTCLLMEADGTITGNIPYPELEAYILKDVRSAIEVGQSAFKQYVGNDISVTAFIEFLQPAVSLVVVGAGNDAIPLMRIADTVGWEVRIVDGRNTHAKPGRFETACQVLVSNPEKVLEQIPIDRRTVFVMITHNYQYDLAMLKALLPLNIPYIGMLGPKKKLERMITELRHEGMEITAEMLSKVFGPVGLEIGAETPEEIAISIIAEICAVLKGKQGGSLRNKTNVIHDRAETIIEQKRLV
jgi:xanthine/CO dehydrogenase XdhC/CoxF family maturation factor